MHEVLQEQGSLIEICVCGAWMDVGSGHSGRPWNCPWLGDPRCCRKNTGGGQAWALVPALACPALWPGAVHQRLCLSLCPRLWKGLWSRLPNDATVRTECLSVEKHKVL